MRSVSEIATGDFNLFSGNDPAFEVSGRVECQSSHKLVDHWRVHLPANMLLLVSVFGLVGGLALPGALPTPEQSIALSWQSLSTQLRAWYDLSLESSFCVNAGTAESRDYTWCSGATGHDWPVGMDTSLQVGSTAKWPIAAMMTGLVADGALSFDEPIYKYLDFWTSNHSDSRSAITLRSLLSFTSGYDTACDAVVWNTAEESNCTDFLACTREMYLTANHTFPAGSGTFSYNSCHLQFAMAMAVAIDFVNIHFVLQFTPVNGCSCRHLAYIEPSMIKLSSFVMCTNETTPIMCN